jgi:hypothetical protein
MEGYARMVASIGGANNNNNNVGRHPKHPQHLYHVSLVVPYEQLTNPQQGPVLLGKIAKELLEANIILLSSVSSSSSSSAAWKMECLWRKVVYVSPFSNDSTV